MTKEEMKDRISMALKDPILQIGFECICKENTDLKIYNEKLLNGDIEKHNKIVELEKENAELKKDLKSKDLALEDFTKWSEARLTEATEILKVVLNKWKEERWILQSEKEVKMIENAMKEAEAFLEED